MIDILGFVAAILTTIAFLPQVYKTYKFKSVKDISLTMYAILLTGVLLWMVYGILISSWPIILANGLTALLLILMLLMKWRYG